MELKQLTEEQIRTMTLQQKDEWWLKNIYQKNMRQLTLRSALTGALLGSVLSLTNLYIGIRTGWTLGVGITSVIMSFAAFKIFSKMKLGDEMSILENNAMQSIATSAGYMTSPLVSSMAGYMMITGQLIPQWQVYCWTVVLGILGALFAFPLKKRAINDEQLPFPEGYAAGVVLHNLHNSDGNDGLLKAKFLGVSALVASCIEFIRNEFIMKKIGLAFAQLPEHWDDFIYRFATPKILGTPLKDLTIKFDTSIIMMGSGALMSMRVSLSMLLGGILNYFFLAPMMIQKGVIQGVGFKNISIWALWGGAAMMTTASIYSFLSAPSTIDSFKNLFKPKKHKSTKVDILKDIELPPMVSIIGVPVFAVIITIMGHEFFGIEYWLGALAVPLVFLFSIMAVKSTGLTAVTPGSAIAKMTQVVYSILSPGNATTNMITAGIASEVSLSASNLLMDIKPAYMLGGKPRHQAMGHVIGIFVGGIVSIPVFYLMFHGDISLFSSEKFPMPSATVWKAVAVLLSKGLSSLHPTSQIAVLVGAVSGILFEIFSQRSKGKFPISPVAFGIAFVLQFNDILSFFIGSSVFYLLEKKPENLRSKLYQDFVENRESIAAGIIAGGSIIGIILLIAETTL